MAIPKPLAEINTKLAMRKITLAFIGFCVTVSAFAQTNTSKKLIELSNAYKNYMFRNEPTKDVFNDIKTEVPENLKIVTNFIIQTITTKNKLQTIPFLSRPDDQILKQIYIIRAIVINLREESQIDNNKLIDSLTISKIPTYELIDNYYGMVFTSIANKNQPFDFSKVDFKLKDYNFKDDTEKGIFFLRCMHYCGLTIWGFMNVAKPPKTEKAYDNIKKFPKFNGQPYYQYTDFYFADFEMNIVEGKGIQSYKSHYLNKYYETLLSHLICLNKENGTEKEKNDLLLGSILKERNLYKYTKYKETLESIFKVQKLD